MAVIAITVHHTRSEAMVLARDLASWLSGQGHRVLACAEDAELFGSEAGIDIVGHESRATLGGADLVVALGGDGTVLRTVELLGGTPVPILGVNLGQLGYLTEVEPHEVHNAITRVLDGDHEIEHRMLLEVVVGPPDSQQRFLALNEALVDRTLSGHTVRMDVAIDGRVFTPYEVDALIVGTPTGSTAYGYSAGGPIVAPTHRLIVLTPVSPHMLFDRTLVLEASSTVQVTMAGHRPGALIIDGRLVRELAPGESVRCTAADEQAHLVVFGPRDFPGLLKAKFKLSDR